MLGNKTDLYEKEEITKDEGLSLAKELDAIFQYTSAATSSDGINNLFLNIGKKFLDPSCENTSNMTNEELKSRDESIRINNIKKRKKKKKCC